MISDVGAVFEKVVELFSIEFTIYGFTFSMWQVFLFDFAAGIVIWFLREVFFGGMRTGRPRQRNQPPRRLCRVRL